MLDKVAVIGAGSWGTTVAAIAARSAPTTLWARRPALGEAIDRHHENPDYLPGVALPEGLRATTSLEEAVDGATLVITDNEHRTATISNLSVTGRSDGPVVWNYHAVVPDQLDITGKVAPGAGRSDSP